MTARNDYGKLARNLPAGVAALQAATADAALGAMRAAMMEPKHGTWWPDQPARSSAPGEAPAIQDPDGGLAADLTRVPVGTGDQAVVSQKDYAVDLEYGTVDGRIAPRPFMAPAVRGVLPAHLAGLGRLLPEALRGR